jgi:RHS repeat-associated protein
MIPRPSAVLRFVAPLATLATLFSGRAAAQTATVTPQVLVVVNPNRTVHVAITWCDAERTYFDKLIKLNGSDITNQFSSYFDAAGCGYPMEEQHDQYWFTDTATITLPAGVMSNSLQACVSTTVCYQGGGYELTATATYLLPVPRAAVRVVAEQQFVNAQASSSRVERFSIVNPGNAQDTFTLAVSGCSSGAIATSCSLSASQVIVAAGSSTAVTASYTASGTAGATGLLRLRATSKHDTGVKDSSWTDVTVVAAPSSGVVIIGIAPGVGDIIDRDLCVTIAVGDAAAAQCGDLRVVHSLPAVRTYNRSRAPVLLYSSQAARPRPIVLADVTLPATSPGGGSSLPDSVKACIKIGSTEYGCGQWPGSQWGSLSQRRRIAVIASDGWTTGQYLVTLEVTYKWPSGWTTGGTPTVRLYVDNRSGSSLGAGWSLAGLERVLWLDDGNTLLLLRGDGSAFRYTLNNGMYRRPGVTDQDSISEWSGKYVHYLPDGARVYLNWGGGHDSTVDRLGRVTRFHHTNYWSRLDSITIAAPGSTVRYHFRYNGSDQLDSVIAPGGRVTRVFHTGFRVDSIRDPDGNRVRFGYGTGSSQYVMTSRKDRRGNTTSFGYDSGGRLSQVTRPLSNAITLAAAETRGLTAAVHLDSAFTQLDGPRSDVSDVTRFWVNGYGAPTRIRDAMGGETRIRYDTTWPGLADLVRSSSRVTSRVWYNGRGLVTTSHVYGGLGGGDTAITSYQWHATRPLVTSIRTRQRTTDASVVFDTLGYDTDGNRTFEQRGASSARRVQYRYNATTRQLDTIIGANTDTTLLRYSGALGNMRWQRTPAGYLTLTFEDALGRDTLTLTPLDTVPRDSTWLLTGGTRTRSWYSAMDRVDSARTTSPTVSINGMTHHTDSVRIMVRNVYDADGNPTGVTRSFPWQGGTRSLSSTTYFDELNRVTGELHPGATVRSYTLDAAGNRTTITTPRGHYITVTYDALNRPTRRIVPQVSFSTLYCQLYYCYYTFPTREGSSLCIAADTSYYQYDVAGNLRRADNGWARVRRGYAPNGALTHDTLVIRNYETNASNPCGPGDRRAGGENPGASDWGHTYSMVSTYDLLGRRTRLDHPNSVDFCQYGTCQVRYLFDDTTGALARVIVDRPSQGSDTASFTYDLGGRLIRTRHLSGQSDSLGYDRDGRVVFRRDVKEESATLVRDAQGRVARQTRNYLTSTFTYGPLGALVHTDNLTLGDGLEELSTDALGNRYRQRETGVRSAFPDWDDRRKRLFYDAYSRLDSVRWDSATTPPALTGPSGLTYLASYDEAGNIWRTAGWEPYHTGTTWAVTLNNAVSYYDAEDRLTFFNRTLNLGPTSGAGGVFEEYRYDALGRRVLVRTRCTSSPSDSMCRGHVERTVWDGSQSLYEIRAAGHDSVASSYMEQDHSWTSYSWTGSTAEYSYMLGSVGYVHAGGIDQPLGVYRRGMPGQSDGHGVSPNVNGLGDYFLGTMITGSYRGQATDECTEGYDGCPLIIWPGDQITADGQFRGSASFTTWYGNLLSQRTDGSGQQYLRNRYYDPQTGRFTQQDPIGLAGGFNLYGFSFGDPINYHDPFGLDPCIAKTNAGNVVVDESIAADATSALNELAALGLEARSIHHFRGFYTQANLWALHGVGLRSVLAAHPGTGNHEAGTALDISVARDADRVAVDQVMRRHGFVVGAVSSEPWHYEHSSTSRVTGNSARRFPLIRRAQRVAGVSGDQQLQRCQVNTSDNKQAADSNHGSEKQ